MIILFDKGFDEPSYNIGGEYSDYGQEANEGIDKKQIIKFAVIGIVILAVIYILFIVLTSQQTIEFEIREMDGRTITENLVILNENGERVYSGREAIHIVTLPPGTYTYRVASMNHKPYNNTLIVGGETQPILIELEKDIDIRLTAEVEQEEHIYVNQEITRVLRIDNLGNSQIDDLEIIPTSNEFNIELATNNLRISAGGTTSVTFTMRTKSDSQLTNKKEETIRFRAKGTTQTESFRIELRPSVRDSDIAVRGTGISGTTLTDNRLVAGQSKQATITISNNNRNIDIENILVEILPEPGYENKLTWFDFLGHTEDDETKLEISKLEERTNRDIRLNINPPINENVDSEFRGRIRISSLGIQNDVILNISMKIERVLEAGLSMTGTSYSTTCRTSENSCQQIRTIGTSSLRNNSRDLEINNINLSIVDYPTSDFQCLEWITFRETNISSIRPNQSESIIWDIEPTVHAEKENTRCVIKWEYDDPINQGAIAEGRQEISIRVTVRD